MTCPICSAELTEFEDSFPACTNCGWVKYSEETLALMAETRREYLQAEQECWPDRVPPYSEWLRRTRSIQ